MGASKFLKINPSTLTTIISTLSVITIASQYIGIHKKEKEIQKIKYQMEIFKRRNERS